MSNWIGDQAIPTDGLQTSFVVDMTMGGVTSSSQVRIFKRGNGINAGRDNVGEDHPDISWLKCVSFSCQSEGEVDTVTFNYEGIPTNSELTKYSMEVSTSEEPIDTHPNFPEFGGIPTDANEDGIVEEFGSKFSSSAEDAVFEKFILKDGEDGTEANNKVGISSYLEPSVTWTEERTLGEGLTGSDIEDIIGDLGMYYDDVPKHINVPSGSTTIPNFYDSIGGAGGSRDWMLINATYEPVGKGGILRRTWRLSGRMGWNQIIYKEGTDSQGSPQTTSDVYNADPRSSLGSGGKMELIGEMPKPSEESYKMTYRMDDKNICTLTCDYEVEEGDGVQLAQEFMTGSKTHPTYTGMECVGAKVKSATGMEVVSLEFKVIDDETDWEESIDISTRSEPIDTHYAFKTETKGVGPIGGAFDEPENGALFSGKTFQKFASHINPDDAPSWWKDRLEDSSGDLVPNPMSGVTNYLEAGMEFSESKSFISVDCINEVKDIARRIDPESNAPKVRSQVRGNGYRNYLCIGVRWEMLGYTEKAGLRVTKRFLLSGNRGWDEDIYDS